MRIKQLENRLTRKGQIYGADIPLVYGIPVYISKFSGITFTTRKQAYKQSSYLSEYKFRSHAFWKSTWSWQSQLRSEKYFYYSWIKTFFQLPRASGLF